MIYESFIHNKKLIRDYDEVLYVNENGEIINESDDFDKPNVGLILFGAAVVTTLVVLPFAICMKTMKKNKETIKKALYNYEKQNPDVVKVSDMTYKVFKLAKSNLIGASNSNRSKGEEDKGNIIEKLFKKKVKDTKINRIVEYFYNGEPVMAVGYFLDSTITPTINIGSDSSGLGVELGGVRSINIAYASEKYAKHNEYYGVKIGKDRKMLPEYTEQFIEKYKDKEEK